MALESRAGDGSARGGSVEGAHCRHCGGALAGFGFHFTCHVCGATYCFVHMRKHDSAHPKPSQVALAA